MSVPLFIRQLDHAHDLPLPAYESEGAAGLDLRAAVDVDQHLIIKPRQFILVPTGLCIELPFGLEAQIRPRSGLASKYGITVLNSPGTIDSDYRGEIKVLLINHGLDDFKIERGLRIAQMIIAPYVSVNITRVNDLSMTNRGAGGFGSTGL
jgi:dUTP pyrophosphatase